MKFSGLSRLSFSAPIDNIDFFCYHRFRKNFKKNSKPFPNFRVLFYERGK